MQSVVIIVLSTALCYVQAQKPYAKLPEIIDNFTIEALYHSSRAKQNEQNLFMSPLTIWTALAAIAEGAHGNTREQITSAIRWSRNENRRNDFKELSQRLKADTNNVKLAKVNAMIVDQNGILFQEYRDIAKRDYELNVVSLKFSDSVLISGVLNKVISNVTQGLITKIVEPDYFRNTNMVLASAIYFSGGWSVPFNASATSIQPFYDSRGEVIGYVNMMYKRFTYALINFRPLRARIIELPYGDGTRFSMYVMLPNPGVILNDMLLSLQNINLDSLFEEIRISKEEYPDDEVDCYLPRFKVESEIDLVEMLKRGFGIVDLFDSRKARIDLIARAPLYVSRMVHKAQIEVTEEGTRAAAITVAEFKSRSGIISFNANRPFAYLIVEKNTNTILMGGFYKRPSLY